MKVLFAVEAAEELDAILTEMAQISLKAYSGFDNRLSAVVRQIGEWPKAAQMVADRPGIRSVPLQHYPYNLFYRILTDSVEIVHVRHGARGYPSEGLPQK